DLRPPPGPLLSFPTRRSSDLLLLGGLFLSHMDGGGDEGHGEHQHDPCHNENGQILSHCCVPLLPLPAAAGLPSSGSPGRSHTNRSEEHTSELQSRFDLVCRLL